MEDKYTIVEDEKTNKQTKEQDDEFKIVEDIEERQEKQRLDLIKKLSEYQKRAFLRQYCPEYRQCENQAADFVIWAEEKRDDILSKYKTLLDRVNDIYQLSKDINFLKTESSGIDKRSVLKNAIESDYTKLVSDIKSNCKEIAESYSRENLIEATWADVATVNYLYGLARRAVELSDDEDNEVKIKIAQMLFENHTGNMQEYLNKNGITTIVASHSSAPLTENIYVEVVKPSAVTAIDVQSGNNFTVTLKADGSGYEWTGASVGNAATVKLNFKYFSFATSSFPRMVACYGGQGMTEQIRSLKRGSEISLLRYERIFSENCGK